MTPEQSPVSSVKPITKSKMLKWEEQGMHKPTVKAFRLVNGDSRYHISFRHSIRSVYIVQEGGKTHIVLRCLHGCTSMFFTEPVERFSAKMKDYSVVMYVRAQNDQDTS